MKPLLEAYHLLNQAEKREVYWLLPGIILRALLEILAIAFMSPFLGLIMNPSGIEDSTVLGTLYHFFGFENTQPFLIFVGALALSLLIISNAFSTLIIWLMLRFSWLRDYSLSHRLLASYLHRPYLFFLGRNSADLGKNMLLEVQQGIRGVLIPGMQMLANIVVTIAILSLLIAMNPLLALGIATFLGITYFLIYNGIKHYLDRIGRARVKESKNRFQTVNEALGGVKEIKLLGKEAFFLERYQKTARRYAGYMAKSDTLSQVPRYLLDTIAFGGLLFILLFMLITGKPMEQAIPLIGLYAFAGYRLIPALQQIYRAVSSIKFNAAAIEAIRDDLVTFSEIEEVNPLVFNKEIKLERISFAYPDSPALLQNFSLTIPKNSSVAFVGATGSGKSTLVDLILGLLTPDSGQLRVDGIAITTENLRAWQRNLGYVPQSIFLTDASIAKNIAFGVPEKELDEAAVMKAAKIANLHDFVETLPEGYETLVGERGVRLSGGQRQRIGIARALYHDPQVLVLDEATSALDNVTEESVFKAIKYIMGQKTVLMIAHRISTVQACDEIFVINKGQIASSGNYNDLLDSSRQFRDLAQVGK